MAAAIPGGNLTNSASITIAAAATSQQIFAGNASRQYLFIQNNSGTDLWINFGIPADVQPPSIRLLTNASIEYSAAGTGVVPTGTVNIIGGVIGQPFTAKQA